MIYEPHQYQIRAYNHILEHPYCALLKEMGLGKTVVTLTALNNIIYQNCEETKALVIAPKQVTRSVWKQEGQKWDHLKHMRIQICWAPTAKGRIEALNKDAEIYVINRENVAWLVDHYQSKWPFPIVVLDESSSFKDPRSLRFRALRLVLPKIKRIIELTGTPSPNGLINLWAPMFLLDKGQRLEKTITAFREKYFTPDKGMGYIVFSYKAKSDAEQKIYEKIGDLAISMRNQDYLELPELIENDRYIDLEPKILEKYLKFEEDCVIQLEDKEITALNAAALSIKLMQFANGAIYIGEQDEEKQRRFKIIHDQKLDALDDVIEEAEGQNVMVMYNFQHDLKRIQMKYPGVRLVKNPKDIDDWNAGLVPLMVGHPASMGHGLNLQDGGHILTWFGFNYSLELYLQAIARLWRQGQKHAVMMHRLIARGTIDEDVIKALKRKEKGQDALMEALNVRVEGIRRRVSLKLH